MKIGPNEIAHVEEAGMLDATPVKLIRTKGGFWVAVGKPKDRKTEEALAAGSHPAIVKYTLEKQYPTFQPVMMKSEGDQPKVEQHSHFLNDDLRKSGHDIYSVQTGLKVEFHINKLGSEVAKVDAEINDGKLHIRNLPKMEKGLGVGLAGAVAEKVLSCKLQRIVLPKE